MSDSLRQLHCIGSLSVLLMLFMSPPLPAPANAQRFPSIQLPTSSPGFARACPVHVPLPVNDEPQLGACEREVAASKNVKDPNVNKNIDQILVENGYTVETHYVTSQDGYISSLYRITGGQQSPPRAGKPSVLVFHGLGGTSNHWVVLHGNRGLAFKLVNAGYDVWLANGRGGSGFSQGHVRYNAERDLEYWNFSFHEMGVYDLPAMVDLMLEKSGNEKVFYIGHSQGGTLYTVGVSEVPELNNKIQAAYLLAPAVFLGGAYDRFLTAFLGALGSPLQDLLYLTLSGRLQRSEPRLPILLGIPAQNLCMPKIIRCGICDDFLYSVFDLNPNQMNYTNIPNMIAKLFNTENLKSSFHYGQNIVSCMFRKYDYGRTENLRRYGSETPPPYNISQITAPLHIFWAEQDALATPSDITRFVSELNPATLQGLHRVDNEDFNHADFIVARDADILVYNGLVEMMNSAVNSDGNNL